MSFYEVMHHCYASELQESMQRTFYERFKRHIIADRGKELVKVVDNEND